MTTSYNKVGVGTGDSHGMGSVASSVVDSFVMENNEQKLLRLMSINSLQGCRRKR